MPEVKDSLRMIQVLMFLLFSGNVSTGFPVNSYGDIVWEEVSEKAPMDGAATEGKRTYWLGWLAGLGFFVIFLMQVVQLFFIGCTAISKAYNFIINVSLAYHRG